VLGPAVLLSVWYGGAVFAAVTVIACLLAIDEWVRLVEPAHPPGARAAAVAALAACFAAGLVWGAAGGVTLAVVLALALAAAARPLGAVHPGFFGFGLIYAALPGLALIVLRGGTGATGNGTNPGGIGPIVFLLLGVWGTDIGAYAAGRTIGGPKLAPRISPKKTWAGLIGGMVTAAVVGLGVALVAGARQPSLAVPAALVLAVVSQAGDLFESAIKRRYDVKDSGHLIPGHGGLLDRVDGLMAAAPAFALFQAVWGVTLAWW
jgi:phosphatidate cytidylyltransferase